MRAIFRFSALSLISSLSLLIFAAIIGETVNMKRKLTNFTFLFAIGCLSLLVNSGAHAEFVQVTIQGTITSSNPWFNNYSFTAIASYDDIFVPQSGPSSYAIGTGGKPGSLEVSFAFREFTEEDDARLSVGAPFFEFTDGVLVGIIFATQPFDEDPSLTDLVLSTVALTGEGSMDFRLGFAADVNESGYLVNHFAATGPMIASEPMAVPPLEPGIVTTTVSGLVPFNDIENRLGFGTEGTVPVTVTFSFDTTAPELIGVGDPNFGGYDALTTATVDIGGVHTIEYVFREDPVIDIAFYPTLPDGILVLTFSPSYEAIFTSGPFEGTPWVDGTFSVNFQGPEEGLITDSLANSNQRMEFGTDSDQWQIGRSKRSYQYLLSDGLLSNRIGSQSEPTSRLISTRSRLLRRERRPRFDS